jgi:ribose transport system permease protein
MKSLSALKRLGLAPVLGMAVAIIALNAWLQPNFFGRASLESNLASLAPVILVSVAQAIVILNRELDLSMGAGISLLNCILASFAPEQFGGPGGQLAILFIVALGVGGVNGMLVAVLGLPSLIVTFATSALWFGCALVIMPQPGGAVADAIGDFYIGHVLGLPTPLVIILVAMALWALVSRHRVGRWIVGTGSNPAAVFQAGVPLAGVRLTAYLLAWIFVFLSAVSISAQTLSGDARLAQSYTLTSVAACVIGGISLKGGRGSPWGALLGAVVLGLIGNVIYFAGVPSSWQELVKGLIIVAALAFMVFEQRASKRQRFANS